MRVLLVLALLSIAVVNGLPFLDQLQQPFDGKTWVVLCASADTWINYGMQADVYHAYQVVRAHGIPDENIIVMHYDDIAHHKYNPTPGIVVNRPGGPDVYKGVPKHYTGKDVTPKNFLGVLQGDENLVKQGKKVVKSGPNDRIFVYLDDHGADKIVAFPAQAGVLHAKDLNDAFVNMHKNKKFAQLVFYLAACEAGSMFDKILPNNINVYAVSATKPNELGWKAYHDAAKYHTYLAVWMAVTWLNNTEHSNLNVETVEQQFQYIKEHNNFTMDSVVHSQHAQEYGDLSIANKQHVGQYLGNKPVAFDRAFEPMPTTGFSLSRDAALNIVKHKIEATNDVVLKQQYVDELEGLLNGRELLDKQMVEYVNSIQHLPGIDANVVLNSKLDVNNGECYRNLVDTFNDNCYILGQNTYALNKLHIFGNICETLYESSDENIAVKQLIQYCNENVEPRSERIL